MELKEKAMELRDKLEMIMGNDIAFDEAVRIYKEIGSYERTIELVWNKYFRTF